MAVETANIKRSRKTFGFSRIFIAIGLFVLLTILVYPGLLQVYDNTGTGSVQGNAGYSLIDIMLEPSVFMGEYVISTTALVLFFGMLGSLALTAIIWTVWMVRFYGYDSKWPLIMLIVILVTFGSYILYIDMVDAPVIWGYSYIPGMGEKFFTSFIGVPKSALLYLPAMALLWLIPHWRSKKIQKRMAAEEGSLQPV